MEPNQERSLIARPSNELTKAQIPANRILGEMVESSLSLASEVAQDAQLDALVREARRLRMRGAGKEMTPNNVRAFELFLHAAERGHTEAQYEVSVCFAFGSGVAWDRAQSHRWLRLAAEQGCAEAQFAIGNGLTNSGKVAEGADWYYKAAVQGHPASQMSLSDCFSAGRGVPQNYCQAYAWAQLAAEADDGDWCGPDWCQDRAEGIASLLTPVQLAEARLLHSYLSHKQKHSASLNSHA